MATGYQKSTTNNVDVIRLLESETAANAVGRTGQTPSATPTASQYYSFADFFSKTGRRVPDKGHLVMYSTAGSGAMTLGACRLFAVDAASGKAGPYGIGADATKGEINGGASFAEDGVTADTLYHREEVSGLSACDGIQIQLGAFGGASTAVTWELHLPKPTGGG